MLPDSQEVKQYSPSPYPSSEVGYSSGHQYRLNILDRGSRRVGEMNWSHRVIILSALVSVLVTAIAFGFLASAIFIPKYFQLSGDLQRLAGLERSLASLKQSQTEFQQQTLSQNLKLREELRDQGVKIESVGQTAEAARQSVEGQLAAKEKAAELARQEAAAPKVTTPKAPTPSPVTPTAEPSWPPVGSGTPSETTPQSGESASVPSLIAPSTGGQEGSESSLGSLLSDLYHSFLGALFGTSQ